MDNIVVDAGLRAKLHGMTGPARLCDADGTPLAVVIPADVYRGLLLGWSESRYQPELAERAWQDYLRSDGQSTAEVLASLQAPDSDPGTSGIAYAG